MADSPVQGSSLGAVGGTGQHKLPPSDGNVEGDDGMEEDEEDDSSATRCPYFTSSDQFHFMTVKEYERREAVNRVGHGSEFEFQFVRPMSGRLGVLENPHGSVRLSQGGTTVLAAVYGPSDIRMSKELPHRAAVDVLFRPKVTGSGNMNSMIAAGIMDPIINERAMEQTITGILESVIHLEDHLQAGFNVILHEIQDDGCLLSCCINAAMLGLLNAGCSIRSSFAAITVCVCGDKIVIDPCTEQINAMKRNDEGAPFSTHTFTMTNSSGDAQILHVGSTGIVQGKVLGKVKELVVKGAIVNEIFEFFFKLVCNEYVPHLGFQQIGVVPKQQDVEDGELSAD